LLRITINRDIYFKKQGGKTVNDYSKIWGGYRLYNAEREGDLSEKVILSLLMEKFDICSMVDFGCATGRWCKCAKSLGVKEVLGIDGDYVKSDERVIEDTEFQAMDLSENIDLDKRYDLAVSLEVAEHLPEEKSDIFIRNLVNSANIVLFSAATPGQGGDYHINEQRMSYWEKKFSKHNFHMVDFLRPVIWNDDRVLPMYRQNCVVYMESTRDSEMTDLSTNIITDIIHPEIFEKYGGGNVVSVPLCRKKSRYRVIRSRHCWKAVL